MAADDVGRRSLAFLESNHTGTVVIAVSADVEFCPPSIGLRNGTLSPCAAQTPQFNITPTWAIGNQFHLLHSSSPPYELDDTLRPPIDNMLHLALAAIRVDLGNASPNNFLTNPEVLNRTLTAVFPQTASTSRMPSKLYKFLHEQSLLVSSHSGPSVFDPFHIPGPSVVEAVYVCKGLKRKDSLNLIVSVFVATVSMFTPAWTVFIAISCWLLNRKSDTASHEATASPGPDTKTISSSEIAEDDLEKT